MNRCQFRVLTCLLLVFQICFTANAQKPILVDSLQPEPFPYLWNTVEYSKTKHMQRKVFEENGKVYADLYIREHTEKFPHKLPDLSVLKIRGDIIWTKVHNGYILGEDQGEWGGDLYWFSVDGKTNYKISSTQVQQFFSINNEIFALTGGSYNGLPMGWIQKIIFKNGQWVIDPYLRTNTASHYIKIHKENIFLISSTGIMKIDNNKKIQVLLDNPIWKSTYVQINSIVISKDIFYAGMIPGIFKYNMKSGEQEWFSGELQ